MNQFHVIFSLILKWNDPTLMVVGVVSDDCICGCVVSGQIDVRHLARSSAPGRHYAAPRNLCTQYHFVCTIWMRNASGMCQFKITYFLQISGNIQENIWWDEGMFITSEAPSFTLSCQLCYGISESSLQATGTIVTTSVCGHFMLTGNLWFCAKK